MDNTKKQLSDRRVILVTKDNYKNYLSVPPKIVDKVNSKNFSLTFFRIILDFASYQSMAVYGVMQLF